MSRQIKIVMLFAAIMVLAATSCLSPHVSQNTILPEYSADFEEISSEEYLKAKENISECTQLPQRDIPPQLKEKIVEEIFDKVLGDEGREFALVVDTLINIYGYYPALGAIVADAAKGDAWGQQQGWLFDTTGVLLGGGFSVIGMAVRADGLVASLGISSSGFPPTPDTLFLMVPARDGRQMKTLLLRRFDTDSSTGTIREWLPSSFFWGPDSSLYICGNPCTNNVPYYDLQHEVYWKLILNGKRR